MFWSRFLCFFVCISVSVLSASVSEVVGAPENGPESIYQSQVELMMPSNALQTQFANANSRNKRQLSAPQQILLQNSSPLIPALNGFQQPLTTNVGVMPHNIQNTLANPSLTTHGALPGSIQTHPTVSANLRSKVDNRDSVRVEGSAILPGRKCSVVAPQLLGDVRTEAGCSGDMGVPHITSSGAKLPLFGSNNLQLPQTQIHHVELSGLLTNSARSINSPTPRSSGDHGCSEGCVKLVQACCESITNVTAPLYGVSANSQRTVEIVQVPGKFEQFVVTRICRNSQSLQIHGTCEQKYSPQLLYIVANIPGIPLKMEMVNVPSHCACVASFTELIKRDTVE